MPNVPPSMWRADWGYLPPLDDAPFPIFGPLPGDFIGYCPGPPFIYGLVPPQPIVPIILPDLLPPFLIAAPPPGPAPPAAPTPPTPTRAADIPGTTVKGGRRAGTNYLFPTKHTTLHVIQWDGPGAFWERKDGAGEWKFSIQTVPCNMSVKDVIESLGGKDDMALTEVVELGGDKWSKGSTIKFKDGKADKGITAWGWGEKRGVELPPVWVVLHKA